MKLRIRYATVERKWLSDGCYQNVMADAELEPIHIERTPCGIGAAANRYTYRGVFYAPADAEFLRPNEVDGIIDARIDRKENPLFKPNDILWQDDIGFFV